MASNGNDISPVLTLLFLSSQFKSSYDFIRPIWIIYNKFLILRSAYCVMQKSLSHSNSLQRHALYSPWNSPGQNTGVGSLSLLQGICPNQGLNPGFPYYRQILYQLSHQGSPRILEWVTYPFSSGSSQPRNRTGVCCIAGGFFTNWAMLLLLLLSGFSHIWLCETP